ncbi:Transposase [Nitrosomonas sp. Nm51]|nr:Transposase [Nitrosomonas sp. Nm51]
MVTRKQYSKEFKLDAISLALDQGYTIAEAARSLELRANMIMCNARITGQMTRIMGNCLKWLEI